MRPNAKTIAGLAVAAMISMPVAGLASANADPSKAKATPGTTYVAETKDGAVSLIVSHDLHQVRTLLFAFKMTCSDGVDRYDYDTSTQIPIAASRRFRYRWVSDPEPSQGIPGATYTITETFSGVVSKQRTSIIGSARYRTAVRNPTGPPVLTCDTGAITFRAAN